jgi:hypothetical protein
VALGGFDPNRRVGVKSELMSFSSRPVGVLPPVSETCSLLLIYSARLRYHVTIYYTTIRTRWTSNSFTYDHRTLKIILLSTLPLFLRMRLVTVTCFRVLGKVLRLGLIS